MVHEGLDIREEIAAQGMLRGSTVNHDSKLGVAGNGEGKTLTPRI